MLSPLLLLATAQAGPIEVIAHRGYSSIAPENTLSAFEAAAGIGVGFELDVTLSKDGEVIVLHDDTLDRTTDGSGLPADHTLAELQELDAGAWFDAEFAGEPLPTLHDVLARFGGKVPIDIEMKSTKPREPYAEAVVSAIREAGVGDQVFITSFDPLLLEAVKTVDPGIRRGQLTGRFKGVKLSLIAKVLLRNLKLNGKSEPQIVVIEHDVARRRRVRRMHRKGYEVYVWTVNEPEDIDRMIEAGVDGIITDHPERVRESLRSTSG